MIHPLHNEMRRALQAWREVLDVEDAIVENPKDVKLALALDVARVNADLASAELAAARNPE